MTQEYQDSSWRQIDGPFARVGFIPIPLADLREVASNNLLNAAGNGGLLATDTTPIFEYTNGNTDSSLRLRWASSNSDAFTYQVTLPPDLDPSNPINIRYLAAMGGATDVPVLTCDHFFNVGGTIRTVATGAVTGTTVAIYTVSIVAASIPTQPLTLSVEVTPGAHTTDTLLLYAVWLEYTRR